MISLRTTALEIEAPALLDRICAADTFCAATGRSVLQLASMKIGVIAICGLCVVQSLSRVAIGSMVDATIWASTGFVTIGAIRWAWHRLARSDVPADSPLRTPLERLSGRADIGACWRSHARDGSVKSTPAPPETLQQLRSALAFRPDSLGQWAAHWGCVTRSVPKLIITVDLPAENGRRNQQKTSTKIGEIPNRILRSSIGAVREHKSTRPKVVACLQASSGLGDCDGTAMEGSDTPPNDNVLPKSDAAIAMPGAIFGTHRGKRTLRQLQRRGQLSQFLLVPRETARALADQAWGANTGIPRDQKMRIAYLTAVDAIDDRGLDIALLTVTSMMRQALRESGLNTPGLIGGEKGNWIPEMLRGKLQAFERELCTARSSLEHKRAG